jgi:hypothetical protein
MESPSVVAKKTRKNKPTKTKPPAKKTTSSKRKTNNSKTKKSKTKKSKTKKSKLKTTSKTKNAAVTPVLPAELPLILDPDNDTGLLEFFRLFGTVVDQKRSYRIVNDRGEIQEISKAPNKGLSRLVASLVTHFSIYCPFSQNHSSSNIFSRCKISDLDGLWHSVSRRDHTIGLITKLHEQHPFLSDGEDALTFSKSYKFGQGHQHYRSRFLMPKDNPTGWWSDGHKFDGKNCFGLHESFKPFFDLLGVPLSVHDKEVSDDDEE